MLIAVLLGVSSGDASCQPLRDRHDCGHVGTTQDECVNLGCCWSPVKGPNPHNKPWCFHPSAAPPAPSPPSPPPPSPHPSPSPSAAFRIVVRYPESNLPPSTNVNTGNNETGSANPRMYLRGNWSAGGLSWTKGVAMRKSGADTWVYESAVHQLLPRSAGPAAAGATRVEFKAIVDDDERSGWAVGANGAISVTTNAAAAMDGTKAGADTAVADYYPWFRSSAGRYEYIRGIASAALGNTRDAVVYLPPSYDENTLKPYRDVLFMHDGENVFNDSTAFEGRSWRAQPTLDALAASGRSREVVVVAVDNTARRIDEYTYSRDPTYGGGEEADAYIDFLLGEVLRRVRAAYPRVGAAAAAAAVGAVGGGEGELELGILGSSLGGLLSCYAGWTRRAFAKVGCMSPSFWWNGQDFNTTVLAAPPAARSSRSTRGRGRERGRARARPSAPAARQQQQQQQQQQRRQQQPQQQRQRQEADTKEQEPQRVFYLDSGNRDGDTDIAPDTVTVRDAMAGRWGLEPGAALLYYLDEGGEHSEAYWGARFHVPIAGLYPPP